MSGTSILEISTTLPTQEVAIAIANAVVEHRLAACAQIMGPITSIYEWKGATQQDLEFSLKMKTSVDGKDALLGHLKNNHPYELPELVSRLVEATSEYAAWVDEQTKKRTTYSQGNI